MTTSTYYGGYGFADYWCTGEYDDNYNHHFITSEEFLVKGSYDTRISIDYTYVQSDALRPAALELKSKLEQLNIAAPCPGKPELEPYDEFNFKVSVETFDEMIQDRTLNIQVNTQLLKGSTEPIKLTVTQYPVQDITAYLSSSTINAGQSTDLVIKTTCNTPPDDYLFTITGSPTSGTTFLSSNDSVKVTIKPNSNCKTTTSTSSPSSSTQTPQPVPETLTNAVWDEMNDCAQGTSTTTKWASCLAGLLGDPRTDPDVWAGLSLAYVEDDYEKSLYWAKKALDSSGSDISLSITKLVLQALCDERVSEACSLIGESPPPPTTTPTPPPTTTPTPPPTTTPTPPTTLPTSKLRYLQAVTLPSYKQISTISLTGTIDDYSRGSSVILNIIKPDRTTEQLKIFASKDGKYDTSFLLQHDSPTGDYRISVEYNEKIIDEYLINIKEKSTQTSPKPTQPVTKTVKEKVPGWIKNNAKWWSEGQIGESDFVGGIQYMIKEKIINIPDLPEQASTTAEEKVPDWIKNNAGWWADGLISEDDFVNGIKWLVEKGIIRV
ncbi:MAG: hypothetical protein YK1309IOTA_1670001 [Marine Group I thaumarchaeote]|nr:MAG: hypothetical protein YK1309IOTA_1670001 [Marine Group I thaumarchaeote]